MLPSEITDTLNAIGHDTTYLSVVDAEGNIVSFIQSVYDEFGSGLVVPGSGFPLHETRRLACSISSRARSTRLRLTNGL